MALNVPQPPFQWSRDWVIRLLSALSSADLANRKTGADVELKAERLILRSPNGTRWQITVSNTGTVSASTV